MNISIRLIGMYDESWEFNLEYGDEKTKFYKKLDLACEYTSNHFHYNYNEDLYTGMSIIQVGTLLAKNQIEKEVIVLISSTLEATQYE